MFLVSLFPSKHHDAISLLFFLIFFIFALPILKRDAYCSFNEFNLYILTLYEVVLRTIILMLVSKPEYLSDLLSWKDTEHFGGQNMLLCYWMSLGMLSVVFSCKPFPHLHVWEINLEAWRNACCCLESTLPMQQGGSASLVGLKVFIYLQGLDNSG